jgi:predicted RNA-binding Zn-ribbon protein involved in translation (DUF1610 family)
MSVCAQATPVPRHCYASLLADAALGDPENRFGESWAIARHIMLASTPRARRRLPLATARSPHPGGPATDRSKSRLEGHRAGKLRDAPVRRQSARYVLRAPWSLCSFLLASGPVIAAPRSRAGMVAALATPAHRTECPRCGSLAIGRVVRCCEHGGAPACRASVPVDASGWTGGDVSEEVAVDRNRVLLIGSAVVLILFLAYMLGPGGALPH